MERIVLTSPFPVFPEQISEGTEVVALGSASQRGIKVRPRSLSGIAAEILNQNGFGIAPTVHARYLLKQAIIRVAPGSDISSMTSRISGILRIVLRTGVDTELLAANSSPRVRQLGLIAAAYRNALRRARLVDRAEMLLVSSSLVTEKRKMLVYGHFRARLEELRLIDALAGDGSVYFLPCGGDPMFGVNNSGVNELVDKGWQVFEEKAGISNTAGSRTAARFANHPGGDACLTAHAFADIDAEVRSTLANVKRLIREGTSPNEIAVVARDTPVYARPISVTADEYGLPVEMDHSIPLETTGFGGFISILLEAIERDFAFEPAARLAMHPFGPGLGEHQIAEARKKRTTGLTPWLEFCPVFEGLCDKGEKTLRGWAESLRAACELLGTRSRAVGLTGEWLAYESFFAALDAAAALEKDREISFEGFAGAAAEILKEESAPMRPRRGGVEVLKPEDMVGSSYEYVFVVGLAEGMFPKPPKDDPVIDFYERRWLRDEHGVLFASASDVAHWEELSFYFTLLAARKEIVLSYPRVVDNAELVPGAFFEKLGVDGTNLPVIREPASLSSVEEVRRIMLRQPVLAFDSVLDSARQHHRVEIARETGPLYDEYDGVIGVPFDPARRTWSASQITTIGQCSFRWFAGRLLRLNAIEEMETGLDPGTRGRLYHKALELAVSRAIGASDIRAVTLANLDDAFAEAEKDESVRLPILPNWDVERREQISELRKAVESPDFILADARVAGVEREFRAEWEGFPIRGTIDRIDDTAAGLIAIDYKTSGQTPKGAKDPMGKLSVDVQIPIYARIALPKLFPGKEIGSSIYYSLTKGKVLRAEQEGDMDRLSSLAGFLRSILADGSFAVDPDIQEKACTYCEFETVCRKGPRLRRKKRAE